MSKLDLNMQCKNILRTDTRPLSPHSSEKLLSCESTVKNASKIREDLVCRMIDRQPFAGRPKKAAVDILTESFFLSYLVRSKLRLSMKMTHTD